jgi:hypothetical protein
MGTAEVKEGQSFGLGGQREAAPLVKGVGPTFLR